MGWFNHQLDNLEIWYVRWVCFPSYTLWNLKTCNIWTSEIWPLLTSDGLLYLQLISISFSNKLRLAIRNSYHESNGLHRILYILWWVRRIDYIMKFNNPGVQKMLKSSWDAMGVQQVPLQEWRWSLKKPKGGVYQELGPLKANSKAKNFLLKRVSHLMGLGGGGT